MICAQSLNSLLIFKNQIAKPKIPLKIHKPDSDDDGALEVVRAVRGFGLSEAEGGRVRGAQEHPWPQDGRPTLQALPTPQVKSVAAGGAKGCDVVKNLIE